MDGFKAYILRIAAFVMAVLSALELAGVPLFDSDSADLSEETVFELETQSDELSYSQGACTDGEYIYILMNDNSLTEETESVIYKIDMSENQVVAESEKLNVCCGCDMTYNIAANEIIVVNNRPKTSFVSIIDCDTLSVKESVDLGFGVYGIAFDEKENRYYAANSGGRMITILSDDFSKIKSFNIRQTDYTWESINFYGGFIYLLGSAPNTVRIYDTRGNEYESYTLPEEVYKPAALVTMKGRFYVTYMTGKGICTIKRLENFTGYPSQLPKQEIITELFGVGNCKTLQGGCCSDKYIYQLFNNSASGKSCVVALDIETWEIAFQVENLEVGHGNDMCWNSKTDEIIIAHNAPNRNLISFFDASTLEYKQTIDIGEEIFSIDYDSETDSYYTGVSYKKQFAVFSSDFSEKTFYKMTNNGYVNQGMTSDGKNLYFVFYNNNCFRIYSKSGKFVDEYALPITSGEPENTFIIDGYFYVGYNKSDYTGGIIYCLNEFSSIE